LIARSLLLRLAQRLDRVDELQHAARGHPQTLLEDRDILKSEISYKESGAFRMQLRPGRAGASSMTGARAILVPPESPGTYHCVSRCVRRAWLCGEDRESGRSFEHRLKWVDERIHELSEIFAVAIWPLSASCRPRH